MKKQPTPLASVLCAPPCASFLAALLFVVGPVAAEEGRVFSIEPDQGVTFSHTGELAAGSEMLLEVFDLPRNQRFLAYRCGPECTTAEEVFAMVGEGRDRVRRVFGIETTGRHYFFVQRRTETGEVGPVGILELDSEDDGFTAVFEGGAIVRGSIRPPASEPADAEPPRDRGTDTVRIL